METQSDNVDIIGAIRRRRKMFLTTFSILFFISVVIALVLPPVYRSQAKILIEGQQIPESYVQSTITSYVEERIQTITQQVMSWSRLKEIIQKFNPYPEMKEESSLGEMIGKLRMDTRLETISATVVDKKSGRAVAATVAFMLSYEGKNPQTVQKVANELAYLYIKEELKTKEKLASATADFLSSELDKFKTQIQRLETEISEYKSAHIGELPENNASNLQTLARLERDYDRLETRLRSIQERKMFLQTEIAGVEPLLPVVVDGRNVMMNPAERLKRLRLELVSLGTRLSGKHPDIRKLKREIAELEEKVGAQDVSAEQMETLRDMEGRLAAMKGKLGPKHPDVVRMDKMVAALTREIQAAPAPRAAVMPEEKPDNPTYIRLKTQIAALDIEMKGLRKDLRKTESTIAVYQRKVDNSPAVEKKYIELTRDYAIAKKKYSEIWNKLMSARVSQGMEEAQRGERFTITDPAQVAEKPYKPRRVLIVILGFILSAGAAVGLSAARESTDHSIKNIQELNTITGVPVFSAFPVVETAEDRRSRRTARLVLAVSMVCSVILILAAVHHFLMPLETLMAQVATRIH